ncbi:uncharacterized protein LOC128234994 [Mya arenaria]|uniref:uncharacterized protein LOC128234994 n=1 Tax=Mya arenaria TaxID=6604 RepID=UPI0022E07E88|nr:uncharacterized protein LOC128234994 [Mya arenaria]XP_052805626.1 uncharacterized protein LOC128234994 [Mya arenaria]XP_052805627.1 uncharacterized protein LOC128234994 [Mya arenaria]
MPLRCCACAADVGLQPETCPVCHKGFCLSCCAMKAKMTSHPVRKRKCECDAFITLKGGPVTDPVVTRPTHSSIEAPTSVKGNNGQINSNDLTRPADTRRTSLNAQTMQNNRTAVANNYQGYSTFSKTVGNKNKNMVQDAHVSSHGDFDDDFYDEDIPWENGSGNGQGNYSHYRGHQPSQRQTKKSGSEFSSYQRNVDFSRRPESSDFREDQGRQSDRSYPQFPDDQMFYDDRGYPDIPQFQDGAYRQGDEYDPTYQNYPEDLGEPYHQGGYPTSSFPEGSHHSYEESGDPYHQGVYPTSSYSGDPQSSYKQQGDPYHQGGYSRPPFSGDSQSSYKQPGDPYHQGGYSRPPYSGDSQPSYKQPGDPYHQGGYSRPPYSGDPQSSYKQPGDPYHQGGYSRPPFSGDSQSSYKQSGDPYHQGGYSRPPFSGDSQSSYKQGHSRSDNTGNSLHQQGYSGSSTQVELKASNFQRYSRSQYPSGSFGSQGEGSYQQRYPAITEEELLQDDTPAYDDIPYALIIAGHISEKQLRIAKLKQEQKNLLERIQTQYKETTFVTQNQTERDKNHGHQRQINVGNRERETGELKNVVGDDETEITHREENDIDDIAKNNLKKEELPKEKAQLSGNNTSYNSHYKQDMRSVAEDEVAKDEKSSGERVTTPGNERASTGSVGLTPVSSMPHSLPPSDTMGTMGGSANMTKHKNKTQQGQLKPSLSESRDDSSDDDVVPTAMETLRKGNKTSEEEKSSGETTTQQQSRRGFTASIGLTPVSARPPSVPPSDTMGTTGGSNKMTKNKNKNLTPSRSTGQRNKNGDKEEHAQGQRMLLVFSFDPLDNEDKKDAGAKDEDKGSPGFSVVIAMGRSAKSHHRAFEQLRHSKSGAQPYCAGCGRRDCRGENLRAMRALITCAQKEGYEVRDVVPDGNCMFAAVIDQLEMLGDSRFDAKSLRLAAVTWLMEHPNVGEGQGTHYRDFMAEDWDKYISRMMNDGEWGDHIALVGVVNVTGHSVQVLDAQGTEAAWTIHDPEPGAHAHTTDHVLVLGHVGEFHYTSLRPAQLQDTPVEYSHPEVEPKSTLTTQVSFEGSSMVEVFQEDHVDPLSSTPVAHLSFLLKHIAPMDFVINQAAIVSSEVVDTIETMFNGGGKSDTHWKETVTGNAGEGTHHLTFFPDICEGLPEMKLAWLGLDLMYICLVDQARDNADPRRHYGINTDDSGCHIGYTKLLMRGMTGKASYLPSSPNPGAGDNLRLSFAMRNRTVQLPINSIYGYKCFKWPKIAENWLTRERCEGWPSEVVIQNVMEEGCIVIPWSHPSIRSPDLEWKFSFALSEKVLFREGLSLSQKYCFIVLRTFCYHVLSTLPQFSLSILKSVFFYACERIPAEYWETSPAPCILHMLDAILRGVNEKCLPNYFIPTNNMIDHLSSAELHQIEDQIVELRSQPMLFLRQIQDFVRILPNGHAIIDQVCEDAEHFQSISDSTLKVFVPCRIDAAKGQIRSLKYDTALETLNQAFQDRLRVSTCDDTMTYQMFLQGSISGLEMNSTVWFSTYADKQLEGQLSKSLIRETCHDMTLVRLETLLPPDVAGSYAASEMPITFGSNIEDLCHDYAAFLVFIGKKNGALPVLYHCHKLYKQRQADVASGQITETFSDRTMFYIYGGIYKIYFDQNQLEFFRELLQDMDEVGQRIDTPEVYICLTNIHRELGDTYGMQMMASKVTSKPEYEGQRFVVSVQQWPMYYIR